MLPHAALQVTRQQEAAVWAPVGRASNSRAVIAAGCDGAGDGGVGYADAGCGGAGCCGVSCGRGLWWLG